MVVLLQHLDFKWACLRMTSAPGARMGSVQASKIAAAVEPISRTGLPWSAQHVGYPGGGWARWTGKRSKVRRGGANSAGEASKAD